MLICFQREENIKRKSRIQQMFWCNEAPGTLKLEDMTELLEVDMVSYPVDNRPNLASQQQLAHIV